MCPLYKKGDRTHISNYRPITVLNTDYKILTHAPTNHLTTVVPSLIHPDQAGFMRGRRIEDQIKLIKVMINKCEEDDKNGAIVCLDQEKAYDKITHEFLWATLNKFDFPVHFINTVQYLYASAETQVIINGEISQPFHVLHGVRQGDPLSCLLFNLAIESLAAMLRHAPPCSAMLRHAPPCSANPSSNASWSTAYLKK
jgi:Reverse transcriptase (RNA-dependent DNA polymerase)